MNTNHLKMTTTALLLTLTSACGGAQRDARNAIEYAAEVGSAADKTLAQLYLREHAIALGKSDSFAEYQHEMRDFDRAVDAVETFRAALRTAEAGIDAYENVDRPFHWSAHAGCIAVALGRMIDAFESAGIFVPTEINKALRLASSFSKECGL